MLCEHQVPFTRAAWLIKMSSAYTVAMQEAKTKKRMIQDPAVGKKYCFLQKEQGEVHGCD